MPKYMTVFSGVPLGIEDAIKGIDAMYHTKIQLTISAVVVCDNPQAMRALELLYGVKLEINHGVTVLKDADAKVTEKDQEISGGNHDPISS